MSLHLDVYVSPYKPVASLLPRRGSDGRLASVSSAFPSRDFGGQQATFPASSASLISGAREAVLIDALITNAEAQRLVEWIRAKEKTLTAVYITHGHGDHFFGLNTVLAAFPQAKALALPEVIPSVQAAIANLAFWRALLPVPFAENPIAPQPMEDRVIHLEGHEIRPVIVGQGDTAPATVVHVPELDAVVGGDVAYNGIHAWLAATDHEKRKAWLAALDIIERLNPKIVVAGHKDPATRDDDPRAILDATRAYIRDFDQAVAESATPDGVVERMMKLHGERGNPYTLWVSADGVRGQLGRVSKRAR
jgi:glyoxylase-like metal-dependent hydrolase (beta-lactamase superfamily II)